MDLSEVNEPTISVKVGTSGTSSIFLMGIFSLTTERYCFPVILPSNNSLAAFCTSGFLFCGFGLGLSFFHLSINLVSFKRSVAFLTSCANSDLKPFLAISPKTGTAPSANAVASIPAPT